MLLIGKTNAKKKRIKYSISSKLFDYKLGSLKRWFGSLTGHCNQHSSLTLKLHIPSLFLKNSNMFLGSAFVRMSALWYSILQWTSCTSPSFWTSLRKKNLILKCFVLPWNTGSFAIGITAWLSTNIYVLSIGYVCKSIISFLIQRAWFTATTSAIYSASVVDWAITSCFL